MGKATFEFGRWEISVHEAVSELEEEWRALETSDGAFVSAFQRYDWVLPLYKHLYADDDASAKIIVFREKVSGQIEMLWPLALENRSFGLKALRFADRRLSDYCQPIISSSAQQMELESETIFEALAKAVPDADVIHFEKWTGNEKQPTASFADSSWCFPYHYNAYRLPLSIPQAEIASSSFFRKHRAKQRKLEAMGSIAFFKEDVGQISEQVLNELITLRLKRFAELGRDDAVDRPQIRSFYEDVALGQTTNPMARIIGLRLNDEEIALAYGIMAENTFYMLINTFKSGDYYKHSPSMLLFIDQIEAAREEGLTYFDFTAGDEPYKFHFDVEERKFFEILYPLTTKGRAAYQVRKLKHEVRKNPALLEKIKQVRSVLKI